MNDAAFVLLPGGFWSNGVRHQKVGLRPLTGSDEAFLLDTQSVLLPAERTTALLARCLTHLGELGPAAKQPTTLVRALTVGDREALLLHLRRLTLGERLICVLHCPLPDCGEPMDLELRVRDLLLPPYTEAQAEYEASLDRNGTSSGVRFRLPTGADQEAVAALAITDPEKAADLLLQRCLVQLATENGELCPVTSKTNVPESVREKLPALMASLDPQAEIQLNLTCPVCNEAFSALFDTATYFFQEISSRSAHLYHEVHLLAFYYHWREAEIMAMTASKRQRYVTLLQEALSGEGRQWATM